MNSSWTHDGRDPGGRAVALGKHRGDLEIGVDPDLGATMLPGLQEIEEIVVPIILDRLGWNRPGVVGGNRALP